MITKQFLRLGNANAFEGGPKKESMLDGKIETRINTGLSGTKANYIVTKNRNLDHYLLEYCTVRRNAIDFRIVIPITVFSVMIRAIGMR